MGRPLLVNSAFTGSLKKANKLAHYSLIWMGVGNEYQFDSGIQVPFYPRI
jgi:hypothetical protein